MTKEKNVKLFRTLLLAAAMIMIFAVPAQAKAAASKKTLSLNKTYTKYDVTNDGKKDTILFTQGENIYGSYCSGLQIMVNGETAYTIKDQWVYGFSVQLLTLSNDKTFLWVRGSGDNGDGPNLILQYNKSSGMFKAVADINGIFGKYGTHIYSEVSSVKGKTVVLNVTMCSWALAGINFDMTFNYKSGTLNYEKKMTNCRLNYYGRKNNKMTTNKNITAYASKSLSGKKYTIKKNKTVKIKCFYLNGSKFEYKMDVNGKTRWKKFSTNPPLSPSKYLFKNLNYYG